MFYCRGTGWQNAGPDSDMRDELCRIGNGPEYATQILALQYEILQNRLLYVGICGASKWAGYNVILPGGQVQRGLALFGRDVSVYYDGWQQPTRLNSNCIEINEVNYCLIDTTLGIIGSFVMCKQKARYQQKAEYVRKAGQINANLLHVLTTIMTKADLYRCPHTMALYF